MKKLFSAVVVLLVAAAVVFAQGAPEAKAEKEIPTLTWLVRQDPPAREAEMEAAANAILEKKLGCHLDIQFINAADYGDKLNMKLAAGEEFDLCFVANWLNPKYQSLATKGALTPIKAYINPENTPNICAAISDDVWNGVKIGGEIYGIPNLQMMYNEPGVYFVNDIAEKAGVAGQIHDYMTVEEMTAVLERIHAYDDNLIPVRDALPQCWIDSQRYAEFGMDDFRYDVQTGKVVLKAQTDVSFEMYNRARDWYKKGLVAADASTTTMENTWRAAGTLAARYNRNYPGVDVALNNNWGPYEYICVATDEAVVGTNAITSTLTAVNSNSKHKELAIKFYDFLYGDPELYNILVYGVEGADYTKDENGKILVKDGAYHGTDWMMGNTFNKFLRPNMNEADVKETERVNATARVEDTTGLVIDDTAIKAELSAIGGIVNEYYTILSYGLIDQPEIGKKVEEMVHKCENAGLAKVIAELQSQVDAFFAK